MSSEIKGPRIIRCPGCGGRSVYSVDNIYRPFCSARCKNNDFGAWSSEGYAVPADTTDTEQPGTTDPAAEIGKRPAH